METMIVAGLVIAAVVFGGLLVIVSHYASLWLQAYLTGTRVRLHELVLMTLMKVNPTAIVQCQVMAVQAGLARLLTGDMVAQQLAGGNVRRVTLALIAASRANIPLDWNTAAAIDLAGRDILEAVNVSIDPLVINCPDPSQGQGDTLVSVARDGIQLKVCVRVTVRMNLPHLVGGATEATVIARVGQSVISALGACSSYREALDDPRAITRQVLAMGLDAQTAFTILSIEIASIDVGKNIGAELQIEQSAAEMRIAQAFAEKRFAMALAQQQEALAKVAQSKAALVNCEADVATALGGAIRRGQFRMRQARLGYTLPTKEEILYQYATGITALGGKAYG